ncbi:MAG: hypothetical protein NZ933_00110 [Bacteroidia bacterium]|nr:hypothetical protein [Bacteroidia bacterium]
MCCEGTVWWVYFSAPDERGFRSTYCSCQLVLRDWESWCPKELVVVPSGVEGKCANVTAIDEPFLTQVGD